MLWAAMCDKSGSDAPLNCIWTKQILEPLTWILAFLDQSAGCVERTFDAIDFYNNGAVVDVYFDASPHGFGGFLQIDDIPAFYTYGTFSSHDTSVLGIVNTESRAQQAFEALAMLICLRMWIPEVVHQRLRIRVRGDNIGDLSLLAKMQPKSASLRVIACELALDFSKLSFSPDFVEHVPGICNTAADALSRCAASGSDFQLPVMLSSAEFQAPPIRDSKWWRMLRPASANMA